MNCKEMVKLAKTAVKNAKKENIIFGLPNVVSKNGIIYYELPSGEVKQTYNWKVHSRQL